MPRHTWKAALVPLAAFAGLALARAEEPEQGGGPLNAVSAAPRATIPASSATKPIARGQWTAAEAWAWHRKVGVIRGFNATAKEAIAPAYPGMPRAEILRRAAAIGYNSVRFWCGGNKDEVRKLIDEAAAHGLTVSLVLPAPANLDALGRNDARARAAAKARVQEIIGEFRNDPRIVLWDLYNEPKSWGGQLRLVKEMFLWAREMGPTQPLTASIYHWLPDLKENCPARAEAEAMADVHNFHLYDCSADGMAGLERMVAALKAISDRPLVCTECLARSRGDTFGRGQRSPAAIVFESGWITPPGRTTRSVSARAWTHSWNEPTGTA